MGIGIEAPEEMLDVAGNILVNDAITGKEANGRWNDPFFLTLRGSSNEFSSKIMLYKGDGGTNQHEIKIINPLPDGVVQFHVGGKINFVVRTNETVLGAQNETDYALKVNGKILTNEVEVLVEQWNDKVFEKNYPLMPLMELENYLQQNKHLPDLPPEKEVLENGIELGMLNALLLKKIEELTLYTIEQQKMMVKHLEMIENQQQQINELKQYVND
ncbi:MAG: hypothetical protein L3J66_01300 [Bacteroidales bacterium]|nr:hypothetical protein [Bacteroidales bacterium]